MLDEIEIIIDAGDNARDAAEEHTTTPTKKMRVNEPVTPPKHKDIADTEHEHMQHNPFIPEQTRPPAQGPPTTFGSAASTSERGN